MVIGALQLDGLMPAPGPRSSEKPESEEPETLGCQNIIFGCIICSTGLAISQRELEGKQIPTSSVGGSRRSTGLFCPTNCNKFQIMP
jgi:hypothetical protein